MPKKINTKSIKYTSREFDTIKSDLIDYAKRYYPDTYKDFNEASFGSLMLDAVSYIGDVLSFYLDYQANESFLQTSLEFSNILKHGKQMGYKFSASPASHGIVSLYILVPANSTGLGPDASYIPVLKKGSTFSSESGANFSLTEDVDFAKTENEVRVAREDASGNPTYYAIKTKGKVISGNLQSETIPVGSFQKFLRVELSNFDITEVISVVDSQGNQYYETDYLSQDVIYKGITNQIKADRDGGAVEILKPFVVPRRFVVDRERRKTFLQFGASSDLRVNDDMIADPASVALEINGKNYISSTSFDPTSLIESDKFGVGPSNTNLTIVYRTNTSRTVNAASGKLNQVTGPTFQFENSSDLNASITATVRQSLEVENEEAIAGSVSLPTGNELKLRIYDTFSAQNRAVTQNDYESMVYRMPQKFGMVKRVRFLRDDNSFKRNLNAYVISEDSDGYLVTTNDSIKNNLKTWVQANKMINDTIDILDAKIANFSVDFTAVSDLETSKYDILSAAENRLAVYFSRKMDIGEPLFITDIYAELKKVRGLVDVTSVKINKKVGGNYSTIALDIENGISSDGRFLKVPKNVILELKYPNVDIKGTIL